MSCCTSQELSGIIEKMNSAISHRGPDNSGQLQLTEGLIFGHQRLSILELSELGNQPMQSRCKKYSIVFNGEIYNYKELASELNIKLFSDSDTEFLIQAYSEIGEALFPKLNGIFSIAIWDNIRGELILVRDRYGVKPLYYYKGSQIFTASSEIKSLLLAPGVPKVFNTDCLSNFFTFLCLPGSETFFEGIFKLNPGEILKINKCHEMFSTNFNNEQDEKYVKQNISENELLQNFDKSIALQTISDVPVGVFFSGGVDSNAIVESMVSLGQKPKLFCADFETDHQSYISEYDVCKRVAEKHGLSLERVTVSRNEFWDVLDKILYQQDEPLADPVSVPVYFLAKKMREHNVPVTLVGEGADEIFFGYPVWIKKLKIQRFLQNPLVKLFLKSSIIEFIIFCLTLRMGVRRVRPLEWIRRSKNNLPIFWGGTDALMRQEKDEIGLNGAALDSTDKFMKSSFENFLKSENFEKSDWYTHFDLKVRLPELMLMRVDKMCMSHSIEARVPFLENHLVAIAKKISFSKKVSNNIGKFILKGALKQRISEKILFNTKRGFNAPAEEWCLENREKILKEIKVFCNTTGALDFLGVAKLVQKSPRHLWRMYVLARWHYLFFQEKY